MDINVTLHIPELIPLCNIASEYLELYKARTRKSEATETEKPAPIKKQAAKKAEKPPVKEPEPEAEPEKPAEAVPVPKSETEPEQADPAPAPVQQEAGVHYDRSSISKACASMRDANRLSDVTALFPKYGIDRLSALTDAQIDDFAKDLIALGAKI